MGGEAEIHQDAEEKSRTKHHYLISHQTIWSRSDRTYTGSGGGAPESPPCAAVSYNNEHRIQPRKLSPAALFLQRESTYQRDRRRWKKRQNKAKGKRNPPTVAVGHTRRRSRRLMSREKDRNPSIFITFACVASPYHLAGRQ
ncbi:hypothetical protein YC2023_113569 [Brassica napus]